MKRISLIARVFILVLLGAFGVWAAAAADETAAPEAVSTPAGDNQPIPVGPSSETQKERCALTPDGGPCKGLFTKYYYDAATGACREFTYGGCEGVVPFESDPECREACWTTEGFHVAESAVKPPLPYGYFDAQYPRSLKAPKFSIAVNGKPAKFRMTSGGGGADKQTATFEVVLGEAERKEVALTAAEGKTKLEAKAFMVWDPPSICEPLGRLGRDEALFAVEPLRFYTNRMIGAEVSFNGKDTPVVEAAAPDGQGMILTVAPEWAAGRNTMEILATDKSGEPVKMEYSFLNLTGGKVARGEVFALDYGYPGSKSGPFFSFKAEGAAVTLTDTAEVAVHKLDETLLSFENRLIVKTTAAETGAGKILIFKKEHFTQDAALDREIALEVY